MRCIPPRPVRRAILWAATGLLVLATAGSAGPAGLSREAAREYFTDLPLLAHTGQEVRFFTDLLEDKVVLISGFYIDCDTICPRQNTVLSQLQGLLGEQLGRDVFLVSVSVDPKNDTLERVADYAKVWKARPGWTFVTGKPENVDWVNYKLGQYTEDVEAHEGLYLLGNLRTGLWMKVPPQAGPEILQARLRQLLLDAEEKPK